MSTNETIREDVEAQEWEHYIREHGIKVMCVNPLCPGHGVTRPGEPETYYLTESQLKRDQDICTWCAKPMEIA